MYWGACCAEKRAPTYPINRVEGGGLQQAAPAGDGWELFWA